MRIPGLTHFITGGTGGIGRHMVKYFHRLGGNVMALDKDAAELAKLREELNNCDRLLTFEGDVTNDESVREAVAATHKKWGDIHTCIPTAGAVHFKTLHDGLDHVLFK